MCGCGGTKKLEPVSPEQADAEAKMRVDVVQQAQEIESQLAALDNADSH